ncbi:hypothetical protein IEQ44_10565 [Nocardioides sp. Y6]|uniref:Transmembrane protein (PGPGW) n=1 Tax=Nocardioides malaquae TaxID=2773426 RepID=A0ABR9RU72_9ACTN|nr:PGPGW domain-containing protein [Nocardioides malaquae]MBE7325101.1 hypothetical protein [Nocardioides malaquae]
MSVTSTGKHVLLQGAGWVLVIVGLAALVLPGPGLLALFAGMAMLATQYEWADRRLAPVRRAALRTAADSVRTWLRILLSLIGILVLIGLGIYWGISVAAPSWWPVPDHWWLVGGWGTGATLIGSGVIALALLVYSYLNFRGPHDDQGPAEHAIDEGNDPG